MKKSKTKKFVSVLLVLMAIIMLLTSCGKTETKTTEPAADDAAATDAAGTDGETPAGDKIKIGGLAPLTGPVSVYGIAADNGAQLAIRSCYRSVLANKLNTLSMMRRVSR